MIRLTTVKVETKLLRRSGRQNQILRTTGAVQTEIEAEILVLMQGQKVSSTPNIG